MDVGNWLLFSSIALVATISPGPAILLVTSHSFSYGLKSALATMLGNISALFLMSALSVAGLSAIILHSSSVFVLVKLVGAAYLIYLGIKLFRKGFGNGFTAIEDGGNLQITPSPWRLYAHGVFVALSNPKAIVFTTALFPQFVDQSQPILSQFAMLVVTFMFLSFSCLFGYAYVSARARNRVRGPLLRSVFSKLFGIVFIVSGGLLAAASPKNADAACCCVHSNEKKDCSPESGP